MMEKGRRNYIVIPPEETSEHQFIIAPGGYKIALHSREKTLIK
jgi:hypothetical protein